MPTIQYSGNGGTITYDQADWLAGLNHQYTTGTTDVPATQVGRGLSEAKRFNPFRWLGYASPGFEPTDVANVSIVDAYLRNVAISAESGTPYAYLIGAGNKFHRLDIAGKSLSNAGSWPRTITGVTTVTGDDCVAYSPNIGSAATPVVYYTSNDTGGSWRVGRFRTDTGAFTDSDVPAASFGSTGYNKPHPMKVGTDDVLYIADGNKLHSIDGGLGASGTLNTAVLTLPQGYIITSFSTISTPTPFLVIYAYYNPNSNSTTANLVALDSVGGTNAKAFFFDYLSLDPTFVIDLNDNCVTGGFNWKGTIGCFTQGNNLVNDNENRNSRLKIWNGSIFETAATFIGNPPCHGGVDIVGDSIQWVGGNGGTEVLVYAYGSPFEGVKAGLICIGGGYAGAQTRGLLRTIGGISGYQIMSAGITTSGGLTYFKANTYTANSSVTGLMSVPQFERGKKGKVRSVRVDFAKTVAGTTGGAINCYLGTDDGSSSQVLSSLYTIDSSNLTKTYYLTSAGNNLPLFNEVKPIFSWTGAISDSSKMPIPRRIVIDFEEVNQEST